MAGTRRIWPGIQSLRVWSRLKAFWSKGGESSAEDELLERDLWQAHKEWKLAQRRLDEALGPDEVDYAVLMLEAAEKRYGMLLRKAKERGLERPEWRPRPGRSAREARGAPPMHGKREEAGWSGDG